MTEGDTPTVARRRVRLAIREARERAGLTQNQVADEMEWSLSKVIRIESGEVSISQNDLKPLLSFVGIKDRSVVSSLLADARIARTRQRQEWYQTPEFRNHSSDSLRRLIEYEAEATQIRSYTVFYPLGPFQTPEYAAALTGAWDHEMPPENIRTIVEARRRRRRMMLDRLDSVAVFMVLDQSVLERQIGGPAVLAGQLRTLHDLASRGLIGLRMMPFEMYAPIANHGSFDLLTLGDGPHNEILYRESGLLDELIEDADTTSRHRDRFEQLWQVAATEVDTIDFIKGRIEALETKISERQSRK
jgi:transcriptional regulator with XRE-family HTH domain